MCVCVCVFVCVCVYTLYNGCMVVYKSSCHRRFLSAELRNKIKISIVKKN